MRRLPAALSVLLALSCGDPSAPQLPPGSGPTKRGGPSPSPADPFVFDDPLLHQQPAVATTAALTTWTGTKACGDVEHAIEDRLVEAMRVQLALQRRQALSSWNARNPGQAYPLADAGSAGSFGGGSGGGSGSGGGAAGGSATGGATGGPQDYTTTNNQVAGVDEADFVKNDGTRMFVVSGHTLHVLRTWPADELAGRSQVRFEGTPRELFLLGDRVLVFSDATMPVASHAPAGCSWSGCQSTTALATRATLIDVADLGAPSVVAAWTLPGRYTTARRMGSVVRTVTVDPSFGWPTGVRLWVSFEQYAYLPSGAAVAELFEDLMRKNEAVIRDRSLEDWLPPGTFALAGATPAARPLDCHSIALPNGSTQLGLSHVSTLDMNAPAPAARTSIFARADEIYANDRSLYVTQRHWWWWQSSNWRDATYIHKLDLSQPSTVRYVASGVVEGHIVDQFSMDEHQDVLRIAHTTQQWSPWQVTNSVSTMLALGGQLVTLGRVAGLAPGERIMSARFMGPTGYIVTFRQTDPLFTIDLSVPWQPRVVGELKVPGFSSYIHPLDATHLLTIGTYQPENGGWNQRAVQLAIFDVSNLAAPRQTHVQLVGTSTSSSAAQTDHRAFNYFPAKGLLAVPFADWGYDSATGSYRYRSDLRVFRVDAQAGFTPLGALVVDDLLSQASCGSYYGCWQWWWQPTVRRSVMADDFVYGITSGGVRVAPVTNLSAPIATARFPYAP